MNDIRHNGLYVRPGLLRDFASGRVKGLLKPIYGDVDTNVRYSRIGYPNDMLYIYEAGKLLNDEGTGTLILYRPDNTAVKSINRTSKEVTPNMDYELIPKERIIKSEDMPIWAARYWFKIKEVSLPIRVQDLSSDQITSLGIQKKGDHVFSWGDDEVHGIDTLQRAFKMFWNTHYGKWKRIKKESGYIWSSCPYDGESIDKPNQLLSNQRGIPFQEDVNPYVTYYEIEPVEQ